MTFILVNIEDVHGTRKEVLVQHSVQLREATKCSIEKIAKEIYRKKLLTEATKTSPIYDSIYTEFVAGMLYRKDISLLQDYCQQFLYCLISVGGPVEQGAISLAQAWEHEVLKRHELSLALKEPTLQFNKGKDCLQIELSSADDVSVKLQLLQRSFVFLLTDIKEYYQKSGEYELIKFASFFDEYNSCGVNR